MTVFHAICLLCTLFLQDTDGFFYLSFCQKSVKTVQHALHLPISQNCNWASEKVRYPIFVCEETTIFGLGPRRADHRLHILPHSGRVTTSLPVAKWGQGQLINQLCLCNNNKTTLSWHPVDGEMMPRTACRALFDIGWVRVACLSVMSLHSQRMSL